MKKIALVTGAGSGIGRESALALAQDGAVVVALVHGMYGGPALRVARCQDGLVRAA